MADVPEPTQGAPDGQDPSVDQKLANLVNAAVGSHLKRMLPKLQESFSGELAGIKEMLQGAQKAPETSKAPAAGDEVTAKLADLEKQLKKERETRVTIQRQAREERAFGELRSELTGKVRPEAVDTAARLLFHADRKVKVADDGATSFVHGDETYDLRGGVEQWLKSKDAALFVPPPTPQKGRPAVTPSRPVTPTPAQRDTPMSQDERLAKSLRDLGLG